VGIPDIDQERIFGRFEKRGRNAGVGLGLSLVKSIIELHGGTVELASRPGEGTRITCTLPLSPDGV
jgi:signal transduction histidine kinase